MLLITTIVWGINFYYTLQEYEKYCEWVRDSELGLPSPYYAWNGGLYAIIIVGALLVLWIPFIWYSVQEKVYPYLKQTLSYRKVKTFFGSASRLTYGKFYGLVLNYFKTVNRKTKSKLAVWYMKCETLEHIGLLIRVFKWIVLPASLLYVCAGFYFFGENALDSMFLGILIFFYSSFLPDLLSIFRMKVYHDVRNTMHEDLPWYKKYALLLFAPLFIGAFFYGTELRWKTTETFHNFKSLAIYEVFLFMLSFLAFAHLPISIGDVTEILSVPLYALTGYLTHLRADLCF